MTLLTYGDLSVGTSLRHKYIKGAYATITGLGNGMIQVDYIETYTWDTLVANWDLLSQSSGLTEHNIKGD